MIGKDLHRGLEKEDVAALIEAHDWLSGLAGRDCDCYLGENDAPLTSPCEICQARRAMDALNRVINPQPITLHPTRLKNDSERIYFEKWCTENKRIAWLNGGFTLIEHLLAPETVKKDWRGMSRPSPVTQHDMTIATTVIQWLGTNCGRCFIEGAEKEIEKRRAERRKFGTDGVSQVPEAWTERNEKGPLWSVADSIASNFVSIQTHESFHAALRRAIHNALCKVAAGKPTTEGATP